FKIGRFSVTADKQQVGNYRSDGVLFSTPTGSTAHAFSAGGPIIEPDCKCIEMNLLAPFSLFNRPIIFSENKTLSLTTRDTDIYFTVDGETPIMFEEDATMYITKSEHYANIIAFGEEYFHNTINNKLFSSLK
ncbi:MAG: NAD(+)/NADH kinase, partial [Oscillospiraceae bacterium]|nr:NAD(+)/NADH kinase [Oscillospiraceae bacterium]